jgi:uncharacterized membrane protein YkvA (DUF1232 family)
MDVLGAVVSVLIVFVGVWALAILFIWLHRPTREHAVAAARLVPQIAAMGARVAADGATPRSAKVALAVLVVWLASPIDLIPEFIPIIGPLDDIVVAAIILRWVGRRVGPDGLRRHWTGSDEGFALVLRLIGTKP